MDALQQVSQKEFFTKVLDGLNDDGCVTYLYDKNYHSPLGDYTNMKTGEIAGEKLFRVKSFDELFDALERYGDTIQHYIPTLMMDTWSHTKGHDSSYVRLKKVMVFDCEFGSLEETISRFKEIGIVPWFVVESRNKGYHVYVLHKDVIGTPKAINLWRAIQRIIAKRIGSDLGALGVRHQFWVPRKMIWRCRESKIYTIDELIEIKKKMEQDNRLLREKPSGVVISHTVNEVWKDPAILRLLNAEVDFSIQSRNHTAFTIALIHYYVAKKLNTSLSDAKLECLTYLTGEWFDKIQWVQKIGEPFTSKEIRDSVNSAFSGDYAGPSMEWIETLAGIKCGVTLYGDTYIRKDKSEGGRSNLRENTLEILSFLSEPYEGLQKDLVRHLEDRGMAKRTVTGLFPRLRDEGYIMYETKNGKKSGTKYELTEKGMEFLNLKVVDQMFGTTQQWKDDGTIEALFIDTKHNRDKMVL